MIISVTDKPVEFRPWRPTDGRVFETRFAFDCETALIDEARPWCTPPYVLGAASDGECGFLIQRQHVAAFFDQHREMPLVLHHAVFDLAVVDVVAPALDIYTWVDRHQVWDTELLHRLLVLGTEGHTASGKGQSTLDHCVERYLKIQLPKDLVDSKSKLVRLSYGQWLNRPPQEIEPIYLEYLAKDALVTIELFAVLEKEHELLASGCRDAWGYVSQQWLIGQRERWGWQTHHIQLKAAVVLGKISANGLTIDHQRRQRLADDLDRVSQEKAALLREHGDLPGQTGAGSSLQKIMQGLERKHAGLEFPRTATNKFATSAQALEMLAAAEPFVSTLLEYNAVEKLQSTFLDKMQKTVLHPSFDVLKTTGRTSSFGEINAQNLPRDDRVRSCIVPSAGHLLVTADYKAIEMVALAQAVTSQFGLESKLAAIIDGGGDPHRLVAAAVTEKPECDVTADERQKAKAINFGKPGGMGQATLREYAKAGYGVELSEEEAEVLSAAWFGLFPEMKSFLEDDHDLGLDVATFFGLTPAAHHAHSTDSRFVDHPNNRGREDDPHSILGMMCLKTMADAAPSKASGEPYSEADVDFFWSQILARINALPSEHHWAVHERRPSVALRQAVLRAVDRGSVITYSGRLRANAAYCARHNTVFQGLAADGAKIALWKLWRAGYRVVNFIHDEVLVEVPVTSRLALHAAIVQRLLVVGMREVIPDVRVDVECALADRWYKKAQWALDDQARLIPWCQTKE